MNAEAAVAAQKKPRSLDAWTEARNQSHLDRSALWVTAPSLIGTALDNELAAIAAFTTTKSNWHGRSAAESKPYAGWCGTRGWR